MMYKQELQDLIDRYGVEAVVESAKIVLKERDYQFNLGFEKGFIAGKTLNPNQISEWTRLHYGCNCENCQRKCVTTLENSN